jgi:hypothetical protein
MKYSVVESLAIVPLFGKWSIINYACSPAEGKVVLCLTKYHAEKKRLLLN